MKAVKVSANGESKRMFDSDLFEFFSRIHPWQPPVIFTPLIGYTCWRSFDVGVSVLSFAGLFFGGVVIWTLLEYWLHRELFHYKPKSKFGQRMIWYLHGVHHDWPNDRFRLVFPPTISLPLAALFFGIFTFAVGDVMRYGLMGGLMTGYLAYDMIHYYTHHFSPKHPVGKYLRKYHLSHHFKYPDAAYGVSNPLWDYVFRTVLPKKQPVPAEPATTLD